MCEYFGINYAKNSVYKAWQQKLEDQKIKRKEQLQKELESL